MRKIQVVLVLLIFLVVFDVNVLLGDEIMRIGYNQLSNLIENSEKDDKPIGALVDYWEQMAVKMGTRVQWIGPLPSTRVILYLKENKIDIVYLASRNKEREALGIFPEKPIFVKQPVVCFRAGVPVVKLQDWAELESLSKIGIVHGHRLSSTLAAKYPKLPLAIIQDKNPVRFSLTELDKGRLDAFIYPGRTGLLETISELGVADRIKVVDAPCSAQEYYGLFSRKRSDLVHLYNKHHDAVSFDKLAETSLPALR